MERAYSVLAVKEIQDDADHVTVRGVASTPKPDRMGDVVEPLGARFKTPMPLLWQHNHEMPVGNVTFAKATKDGIPFVAEIPVVKEAGKLKERVDEAIQSIKYSLVNAVSIGFRALKSEPLDGKSDPFWGPFRFKEWEWMELSLVTIPANAEAVITAVKSIDAPHAPATGRQRAATPPPAVAGARQQTRTRGGVKLISRSHP